MAAASSIREAGIASPAAPASFCSVSTLLARITVNPEICHGRPVVRGLRYPVESLLEYLVAGDSVEELLQEFPDLQREDFLACIEFASSSSSR